MVKVKKSLVKTNKIGSLVYSKRTIKKSCGDDFTHNVRVIKRLRSKKK